MRRIISFRCEGDRLFGTIDEAGGKTGVLIVSGGNEVRCGAHRGMATLAAWLSARGVPVFRFDRRGIGDSEGRNSGYADAGSDMAAALATFRREQPQVSRVVGFGNCDAATALLLLDEGCDALVLANPWLGDEDAAPPPAALHAHYRNRLVDPEAWRRLTIAGIYNIIKSLVLAFGSMREQPLSQHVAEALGSRPTTIVLADGDRTAQVFAGSVRVPASVRVVRFATASHSFAGQDEALADVLLAAVCECGDKSVSEDALRIQ